MIRYLAVWQDTANDELRGILGSHQNKETAELDAQVWLDSFDIDESDTLEAWVVEYDDLALTWDELQAIYGPPKVEEDTLPAPEQDEELSLSDYDNPLDAIRFEPNRKEG